jgi:hydroxyethylthiazole kinase-like uncharacterized protein yjeF
MNRILPPARLWPLHSVAATRGIEAHAALCLPPHTLMRRAGDAVARLALAVAPHSRRVWVAAGPGNNGGDGLEAAAQLQAAGKEVTVHWLGATQGDQCSPQDSLDAHARARSAGVQIFDTGSADWPAALESHDVVIDALLGIGASRAPAGPMAEMVDRLNAMVCPVIAVDVPSGLDADRGQPWGPSCVRADHTLSLLTLKPGLFTAAGRDQAGTVWLDSLEVADSHSVPPDAWLSGAQAAPPPRRHAQHKGSFGDVVVVGGATGMAGAALLAARAAQAAGAGRVFVDWLQDASQAPGIDVMHPELMMQRGKSLSDPAVLKATTVVCGCGGGSMVRDRLPRLISLAGRLVLDADALNALATDAQLMKQLRQRHGRAQATVLTPHPLEAARLLACDVAQVQSDRMHAARALAEMTACVVVLKGSGSITAASGHIAHINGTGNASLASGGTGDVLAGWLGGCWAQAARATGLKQAQELELAFATASQAVADHGAAAEPEWPAALAASELIERLHRRRANSPSPTSRR